MHTYLTSVVILMLIIIKFLNLLEIMEVDIINMFNTYNMVEYSHGVKFLTRMTIMLLYLR